MLIQQRYTFTFVSSASTNMVMEVNVLMEHIANDFNSNIQRKMVFIALTSISMGAVSGP